VDHRKLARGRAGSLLFIVCLIPFWVSETVRTLGWMILLRESGVLPALLVKLGLTAVPVELLYRDATILVGLVYTSLLSWWCRWCRAWKVWTIR